ncbi:Conserved_hypothetical protein [Hexamita inflata]|uniref:Uncharacterized protein n=1 Tax=Hexamita inflata TaxID=28002 RepID=A0AA86TKX5_9EUKA|nr:Conserved hypothetical protein [Hexamita inflata]
MLSQISSPHLNPTINASMTEYQNNYQISSQVFATKPILRDEVPIQDIRLKSVSMNEYQSAYPLCISSGDENQLQVKVFSTAPTALLCKCQVQGAIDGFCRPLLERISGNDWMCKLFVQGKYPGSGQVFINLQDNLTPVGRIQLDFVVIPPQPASNPLPVSTQINPSAPILPLPLPVQQTPVPVQTNLNNTLNFQNNLYQTNLNYQTQHSQTPMTYLNAGTAFNPDMMELTNKYLCSSNINDMPMVDTKTYTAPMPVPEYSPKQLNQFDQFAPQQIQYSPQKYQTEYVEPVQDFRRAQDQLDIQLNNLQTNQNTKPAKPVVQKPPKPSMTKSKLEASKYSHMLNVKTEGKQSTGQKMIRVLPSDVLFDPAYDKPTQRVVRIRNVTDQSMQVQCVIAHRIIPNIPYNIEQVVDFCDNQSFRIVSDSSFKLNPCLDPSADIQAQDIQIEFKPLSDKNVFIAKMIIQVKTNNTEKSYQVPLLGVAGIPFIVPVIIDENYKKVLQIQNDGTAPAFVKISSKIIKSDKRGNGHEEQGRYRVDQESVLLKPGQICKIQMYDRGFDEKAEDESNFIELRSGNDYLRLLALGKEGHGEWKSFVEKLQLKDDVLRIMGENVEVTRITAE